MNNAAWKQRSLEHVWHPCTQMSDHAGGDAAPLPLIPIRSAEGAWLEDFDGKRYLDAVSSWWTNIFGHRHPYIVDQLKQQLDTLDHVMLAGFSHQPVIELSERLVKLVPPGLTRCFYADNGSSTVEVALKMSFHYWLNQGQPRKTRFVTLSNSYHGETLGALALGDTGLYRDTYSPLLLQPLVVPSPDCYERMPGQSWEDHTRQQFHHMEQMLAQHADEVCAVIVEPLVQCAGGMRMYHPIYLTMLREACSRYGVHLIADEIAVGFGRTGQMFACNWAPPSRRDPDAQPGITPDFICLSKGLTGGTLPLAVTMTREDIYAAFYADYCAGKAFLHSHSYTGNPLACRAALATLDLFETEKPLVTNRMLSQLLWSQTAELRAHPHVAEIRQQGMILAIELSRSTARKQPYPAEERRGLRVYRHALERGVLLRPLGNVIYFMPPYVITPREVETLCKVALESINLATAD
ncbi:adenosylmethionine--8-amino-7-oxononanoate transaminase [Sinimarinibacterium sp. CAU 1509]|uniref:adenosylmethionine--8-amino-7-oxononanoate transaminase n=1 Tax=Sinimarinibacterium sp. CAU 1509 TaxID=2562283 RepID=UPI0010AD2634|nr:adenosylmethionine--8-amino-7-oxononanoate transaminase [Sinimarinibacterium sp. CAU 1509]TJY61937.1 adenosylmethionine--8-amino-7-oxononanoate transaminase [Sinimarinibacterium sp. CAU 1509]